LLTYFADASNEEKQTVIIIIKPMPNNGEFINEDSVRLLDIRDWFSFSTSNYEKRIPLQHLAARVNSIKKSPDRNDNLGKMTMFQGLM
jgi:hypothetical protein